MAPNLICVGCGIKGVAHLTIETVGWIRSADVVCYVCSDPATSIWIGQNAKTKYDLASCYAEEISRSKIYERMVDIILGYVRSGGTVCVVFYGHPGVFVYPTHAAIAAARREGYIAVMLPGISAADCLFADLGFDPSQLGCAMYEATDLLLRKRDISTASHLIVWQIGVVGDPEFRFGMYENENVRYLVEYLGSYYTADHSVCHYQAAQFPVCEPVIEWMKLKDLPIARLSTISTLYVPPSTSRQTDAELGKAMGYLCDDSASAAAADHRHAKYTPPASSSRLANIVNGLAIEPARLIEFMKSPAAAVEQWGLTAIESQALATRSPALLRSAIRNGSASST